MPTPGANTVATQKKQKKKVVNFYPSSTNNLKAGLVQRDKERRDDEQYTLCHFVRQFQPSSSSSLSLLSPKVADCRVDSKTT